MTEVALFDVVIPGVIAWVLVDDLLRSVKASEHLKPVVNKLIENKAAITAVVRCSSEPCSLRR
ncbi:hypothetical protein BH11CYA1_BH11CYA1_20220 [soil metagenome]